MKQRNKLLLSLIRWLTYLFIIGSPLLVNYHTLPTGWELPKVTGVVIFSYIVLTLYSIHLLFSKKREINYKKVLLLLSPVFLSIVSLLIIPQTRAILPFETILHSFQSNGTISIQLVGNTFRHMGILTLLPMLLSLYVLSEVFRRKDVKWIALSIGLSACIQAGVGIYQYYDMATYLFSLQLQKDFVTGTFGQPNFLASWLVSGFISIYYLSNKETRYRWLGLVAAMIIAIVIVLTNSTWATYVLAITLWGILIIEISNIKVKLFLTFLTLGLIASLVPSIIQSEAFISRLSIWNDIYYIYVYPTFHSPNWENISRFIVGGGPDTLHYTLASHGVTQVIDRAHNIFLDIFTMFGLTGLSLTLFGLWNLYRNARQEISLENKYLLFLITIWMLQSSIHTYSILNLYLFLIVIVSYSIVVARD